MIKQTFDMGWEYHEIQDTTAAILAQWQPVILPHDASIGKPINKSYPTGCGGGYAWSGVVTYRKKFFVPVDWRGREVKLEFEGVYQNAEVSVNRDLVLLHPYGYSSFVVDLTPYLAYGAENEITVVANNSAQPNSRWYSGTGLYRHVRLRLGGNVHIPPWGVFVTTPVVDPAASIVSVATEVANTTRTASAVALRSTILDASGALVAHVETPVNSATTISQSLTVSDAHLWSVDDPYLYTLVSEVLVDGSVADTEKTLFGIRTIVIDAQNGFRLNGAPMKLKGGCIHHSHGLLGAASYDRAEERKVELMKSAGFNALRCAHNPPAPALLDACDRLGMLVIDEAFDCWRMGFNSNDYHLFFEDWWQRDIESMVKRDRNHPSVVAWSIGNEVGESTGISNGLAWAKRLADFVHSLDMTRAVTSAVPPIFDASLPAIQGLIDFISDVRLDPKTDNWGTRTESFGEALDVFGYNYMIKRYGSDGSRYPERVILGTESFPHWAYAFWDATRRLPYVIGDFVWAAIDYLGEGGVGQVTLDGSLDFFAPYPYHLANCGDFDICGFKRPQSYFRDILWGVRSDPWIGVLDPQHYGKPIKFKPWGWEPVIDSWTFPGWEGRPTRVEVYCADEEVELLINGVSMGRKPTGAASQNKAVFDLVYEPGVVEAVGYSGGQATGKTSIQTASQPVALRLAPDRLVIDHEWGDLAYITAEIVDADGRVVKYADSEVIFEIAGAGDLAAVGTANPTSEELYVGNRRQAYEGRLIAVVRSNGQSGEITLTVCADGLASATARIAAV